MLLQESKSYLFLSVAVDLFLLFKWTLNINLTLKSDTSFGFKEFMSIYLRLQWTGFAYWKLG